MYILAMDPSMCLVWDYPEAHSIVYNTFERVLTFGKESKV